MNKESGRGLFPIYCNAYLYLDPSLNLIRLLCDGIASMGNIQISNSKLCESSKCWVYSAVNHPWWMSMLFHRRGLLWLGTAVRYNYFVSCILIENTCFTIIKCKCISVTKITDSAWL